MKHIRIYMVVCLALVISLLSSGCLQGSEKPPMSTPTVSVGPTISGTSPAGTPVETIRTQFRYIVFIDDYGFNKVSETTNKKIDYKNFTLNINVGDTVEWRNEADYNTILTLISNQNLWAQGDLRTKLISKPFNYTFTKSGTYTFRLKEETRYIQTIIVQP